MFARISNSWELVKASFNVLRSDKELVLFPIVSFIGVLIVTATFAVPMLVAGVFDSLVSGGNGGSVGIFGLVIGFLFYVVMYFVIIFSNSALVGAALIRLRGGDPTLSDGFRIALAHLGPILGYALISATVGMILRAISERGGIIGQIVSSLIGFAWNVATFLVVPILVVEGIGPVEAVKRSAQLLRQTWGEQLIGNFSIGAIFGLLILGAVLLIGGPVIALAISVNSVALLILGIILVVLLIAALALLNSTLSGIYTAAVYRYAVEGETGGFFDEALVQGAFRRR